MPILAIIITSLVSILVAGAIVLLHFFPRAPRQQHAHYDFALVLGCPCLPDGSLSRMQRRRMDHALWLYEQNACSLLIVSGGSVKNEHGEAAAMLAYARRQHAIHAEAETRATNTYENFVYARALWEKHHCHSAIIVTSPFHARRANYFAKRYFSDYCISTYAQHDRLRNWPIEWYCMCKCLWIEWKIHRQNKTGKQKR